MCVWVGVLCVGGLGGGGVQVRMLMEVPVMLGLNHVLETTIKDSGRLDRLLCTRGGAVVSVSVWVWVCACAFESE